MSSGEAPGNACSDLSKQYRHFYVHTCVLLVLTTSSTTRCMEMADRPAKRQRRSTCVFPDDGEDPTASTLPLRSPQSQRQLELDQSSGTSLTLSPSRSKTAKVKGSPSKATLKASPKPSPDKRKNSKPQPDKSKSLHSFFGKATEDQRWRKKSATPDIDINDDEPGEDIEDDLSDSVLLETEDSKTTLDRRKPVVNGVSRLNGGPPSSSQRFVKPALPSRREQRRIFAAAGVPPTMVRSLWSYQSRRARCAQEEGF